MSRCRHDEEASIIAITETAQKNQDALFANRRWTLKATDSELIELFDNWAFDEVLESTTLDTRTRLMVQLAAIIACHAMSEYRVMVGGALNGGVTSVEVKEIVYPAVPYAGMARVFDFLHVTNEVLEQRDIEPPLPGQSKTTPETRYKEGLAAQKRVLGAMID